MTLNLVKWTWNAWYCGVNRPKSFDKLIFKLLLKTICFVTTSNTVNYNSKIVFIFHISLVITTSLKNPFIHYFTIFILSSFHLFIHSSIKCFKIIVLIFNKSFIHLWKTSSIFCSSRFTTVPLKPLSDQKCGSYRRV